MVKFYYPINPFEVVRVNLNTDSIVFWYESIGENNKWLILNFGGDNLLIDYNRNKVQYEHNLSILSGMVKF